MSLIEVMNGRTRMLITYRAALLLRESQRRDLGLVVLAR